MSSFAPSSLHGFSFAAVKFDDRQGAASLKLGPISNPPIRLTYTVKSLTFVSLNVWNCQLYLKIDHHNNLMRPVPIMAAAMVNRKKDLITTYNVSLVLRAKVIDKVEGVKVEFGFSLSLTCIFGGMTHYRLDLCLLKQNKWAPLRYECSKL